LKNHKNQTILQRTLCVCYALQDGSGFKRYHKTELKRTDGLYCMYVCPNNRQRLQNLLAAGWTCLRSLRMRASASCYVIGMPRKRSIKNLEFDVPRKKKGGAQYSILLYCMYS